MNTDFTPAMVIGLYHKLWELRKDVLSRDWTDDKMMSGGAMKFAYLSTDKILRTISPLIPAHGLEMVIEYSDAVFHGQVGNVAAHWSVRLTVTLIDIDTGAFQQSVAYGEAADTLDKGLAKAQTYALKKWATSFFMISDGIDTDNIPSVVSSYRPVSEEQVTEIKKVMAANPNVMKAEPAVPKADQQPNPAEAQKPAKKAAEKKKAAPKEETPAEPAKPQEEAAGPQEREDGMKAEKAPYKMSEPHRQAIEKILSTWKTALSEGRKSQEEYDAMYRDFEAIGTLANTFQFIKKYPRV